jgi:hypothetical protein
MTYFCSALVSSASWRAFRFFLRSSFSDGRETSPRPFANSAFALSFARAGRSWSSTKTPLFGNQ